MISGNSVHSDALTDAPDARSREPRKREVPRPDDEGRRDDRDPVARKDSQRAPPGEGHRARSLATLQQQVAGEPEERHDRDRSAVAGLPARQHLHGVRPEPAERPRVKHDDGRGEEEAQRGDAVRTIAVHSRPHAPRRAHLPQCGEGLDATRSTRRNQYQSRGTPQFCCRTSPSHPAGATGGTPSTRHRGRRSARRR